MTEWYQRDVATVIDIYININKITCSVEHPFWVKGAGWLRASELEDGMVLLTRQGEHLMIDTIRHRNEVTTVHNIEIDGSHTYFVSEMEVLSHNMCGGVEDKFSNTGSAEHQSLIKELSTQGIKHTPEDIVAATRLYGGKIVFLETGNSRAGLEHILSRHGDEFKEKGIETEQVPDLIFTALEYGSIVGSVGSKKNQRPVYEVFFNGSTQRLSIGVSNNGFIVTAHPAS